MTETLEEKGPSPTDIDNCVPILIGEDQAGWLCRSAPMIEVDRTFHRQSWCFYCRHTTHHSMVLRNTIEPNYWGPSISIRCDECNNVDADLFPGRAREWDGL